ncbi:rhomboid family intramembrane serine protease [Sphingomonas naphthae]|uniref:Rhomboid family intramembrane serine protease n=1 Tax=Sphingomonas naphthae TaxID=1813468 RepID=A0ABY7TP01_9SPHN|nr:rhomboid family intramembrane serine protease [Sphingomonas naphthae]WCT73584.1 rhomboid family intramembrane serine protease [Sphingomonas naphthae]
MKMPPAKATVALVGLSCAVYLIEAGTGATETLAMLAGFIPARLSGAMVLPQAVPAFLTPLTSAFLHGGLLHLAFNMLLLGYCGRAVEQVLGSFGLVALYVVGAIAAAAAHYAIGPASPVPLIGASGAASAVIAAYAIFYGERKPLTKHPGLARALNILWLAAGWIGVQLLVGIATAGGDMVIAVAAHIGGFVAGLALAQPLLRWRYRKA